MVYWKLEILESIELLKKKSFTMNGPKLYFFYKTIHLLIAQEHKILCQKK